MFCRCWENFVIPKQLGTENFIAGKIKKNAVIILFKTYLILKKVPDFKFYCKSCKMYQSVQVFIIVCFLRIIHLVDIQVSHTFKIG